MNKALERFRWQPGDVVILEPGAKGYNPEQPRHPAGTSEGGQFAPMQGGGGIITALMEDDEDDEFDVLDNPAAHSAALEIRDVEAAKAHFEWLREEADAAHADYKESYKQLHNEHAPPAERAAVAADHIRNAHREDMFEYALTTERNAVEAVDQAKYRAARHEYAVALSKFSEKEAAFAEKLAADGVLITKGYGDFRVTRFRRESYFSARQYEDLKKDYPGLTDEHIVEADDIHKDYPEEREGPQQKWLQAYYGEEATLQPRYTILGTPSDELPPGVRTATGRPLVDGRPAEVSAEDWAAMDEDEQGVTLEAYENDRSTQLDVGIAEFMESADVAIQMKLKAVERISGAGKLRNGFEKGAVGSVGRGRREYFDHRRDKEEELFDISTKADGMKRPIYGYLEHPGRLATQGADIGGNYGGVQIVLKPDVKARTSFTIGDSLDNGRTFGPVAYAVTSPPTPDLSKAMAAKIIPDLDSSKWQAEHYHGAVPQPGQLPVALTPQYIEAQIHGGVFFEDIAEVRIPRNAPVKETTLKKFKKAGVEVVRTPPRHAVVYNITEYTDWDSVGKYHDPGDKDDDY